jgi:hypothetical protein
MSRPYLQQQPCFSLATKENAIINHEPAVQLVVAEVALALIRLVSAGLLLRSLQHLFAVAPGFDQSAVRYAVSPGYLETLGIPPRRGRLLDAHDLGGAPPAVLINESFAKREFPGRDPVGQRVHVGSTDQPWYIIVGVVGDTYVGVIALLLGVSGIACWVPAWRAARVDPSITLRAQ